MRKRIIAGNWKMNETFDESVALASAVKSRLFDIEDPEVVLCPPFTSLSRVGEIIRGTMIELGAQNTYWERSGAYTGEMMRKEKHVRLNLAASELGPLPEELHARLREHRWDRVPAPWSD